jgi:opacity protein-like surface antigen
LLTRAGQECSDLDVRSHARIGAVAAFAFAVLGAAWPSRAWAEPYVAGYAGVAFTERKDLRTEIELSGTPVVNGRARDLEFDRVPVFGGKAGYFFDVDLAGGNTGIELDVYHFEPDVSRQTVTFSGMLAGATGDIRTEIQPADVDITAITLNALYRFRLLVDREHPRGRLQPYVGIGVGAFIARLATTTTPLDVNKEVDDTDVRAGVQALAGLRWLITPSLSLFAEYKFVQTQTFSFKFKESGTSFGFPVTETARDRASITSHLLYGGLGFHW